MSPPLRAIDGMRDPGNLLRQPPANLEAERALLGAILKNNRAFDRVSEFLAPGHFADQVNGRIYHAVATLIDNGKQVAAATLQSYLAQDDLVNAAGGLAYLTRLVAGVVTVINAADYGRLIYDLYMRREIIALGEDMVNEAFDVDPDVAAADVLDRYEQAAYGLRAGNAAQGDLVDFDTVADKTLKLAEIAYQHDGALVGITTGLAQLDKKLGGLQPCDLVIIAARPSMGKTALAMSIAVNAARYFKTTDRAEHKNKRVAFFSLEMSDNQLMTRIFAHTAKVDSYAIRTGGISAEQFSKVMLARQELSGMPLHIDETPGITLPQMRARARRMARKGGLGLIVVDYLQLISMIGKDRNENRTQEISAITRGLKALAKELDVPVIALSQLSRAVEQREDKRPMLADLRESGSIEADADVVMFVYRDEYYLERDEPKQRANESKEKFLKRYADWEVLWDQAHGKGEVIIAKQRQGPLGTVTLSFIAKHAWWHDHVDAELPAVQQDLLIT